MLYLLFKFIHVLAAMVWVGGVLSFAFLNFRLIRGGDPGMIQSVAAAGRTVGMLLIGPSAALTLLTGIAAVVSGHLSFGSLWVSWGFVAVVLSLALGASLIRITTEKLVAAATAGDAGPMAQQQRKLALWNAMNLLLLISTVGMMVFKPTL